MPPPADSYPFGPLRVRGLHRPITGEVDQVADALSAGAGWDHLSDTLDGLVGDFHGAHYLLGASSDVQGSFLKDVPRFLRAAPSEVRKRYTAAELKGRGWTLLAEFTYEPRLRNFEFADGGSLYYVIPTRDLVVARFDRVIGSIQSA